MDSSSCTRHTRYLTESFINPPGVGASDFYRDVTLGASRSRLEGSLIIPCGDDAVEFVAKHHSDLSVHYLLERQSPKLQLELLDKLSTLEKARRAGLDIPNFWDVRSIDELGTHLPEATYPLMLKPYHTYLLHNLEKRKYRLADNEPEVLRQGRELFAHGIEFMLCEMIPGPDSQNCSYYTYRDEHGKEYLSLTKRCVRRNPINEGAGTYQLTDRIPDVADAGKRFFDSIDYKGYGSIEFKRDPRDNSLKVMECNNRFTAVTAQIIESGANVALLTYADVTGQSIEPIEQYETEIGYWSPYYDFKAFQEVKRRDSSKSWSDWGRSIIHSRTVFPYFDWRDPFPYCVIQSQQIRRGLARVFARRS
ncbi:MAG: hypothetical protein AAGA91_17180 [Pseudomonadota bacterium]